MAWTATAVLFLGCKDPVTDGSTETGGDTDADADGDSDAESDADRDGDTYADGDSAEESETDSDGDMRCDSPDLVWRSANKTWYTSIPDPESEECIAYNGCEWSGWFAGCDDQKTEEWVAAHNIAAAFPDFDTLRLHDLCLRRGSNTIIVTVIDTCSDSDCDGCCTRNQGGEDQLIDLESYTNDRWGEPDGAIEWADLGPTPGTGCE